MIWDFEKNAVVADEAEIPDDFKPLYEKNSEGKWSITAQAKPIVSAYVGMSKSHEKAKADLRNSNKESADRKGSLKQFEELAGKYGIEIKDDVSLVDALNTHIESLMGDSKAAKDAKVNIENIQKAANTRIATEQAAAQSTVKAMEGVLAKHLIEGVASGALAKLKGDAGLLMPHVRSQARVVKEGEDYVVRVVDDKGEVRTNQSGGLMSVEELVTEFKTTYPRAFESEANGGGGKQSTSSQQTQRRSDAPKSSVDKIAAGLAKGQHVGGKAA